MRFKRPGFHAGWLGALSLLMILAGGCNKGGGSGTASPAKLQAEKSELLAWNLKTIVDAYNNDAGFTNASWDYSALQCLNEFARVRGNSVTPDEPWAGIIASNAAVAMDNGCKDPMVGYLFIKFAMGQDHTKEEFSTRMYKNAKDMYNSAYPVVRKCYAQVRALEQMNYAYGTNTDFSTERFEMVSLLLQTVPEALEDKTLPPKEAYELCEGVLYQVSGDKGNYQFFYKTIEQPLFKNWPDSYAPWLIKGNYYIDRAWQEWGDGYISSASHQGRKQFDNNIAEAKKALEHAWKLDPSHPEIAESIIKVTVGEGGRDEMERWFHRAMDLNTNDIVACQLKMNFLTPVWYGSDQEMLTFGRECVNSTKWGGRVPLVLVDAHIGINFRNDSAGQAEYWKQSEVWADVESAYERVFELNPDDNLYQNYAWYAYHAEQWDKLNELIPRLGPENYSFFGGKEEFEKMVRLAKEHAK